MKSLILLISFIGLSSILIAQEINYLPTKFHVITDDDGNGGISRNKVLDQLCLLNKQFEGTGLQFYIERINEINSTIVNEQQFGTAINIMNQAASATVIDIFIVDSILLSGGPPHPINGGAFYDVNFEWVLLRQNSVAESKHLARAIGCYFGLLPCYTGWAYDPYDPSEYQGTAPAFSPNNFLPTELMDGSNCEVAGDGICDTPPDYNFFPATQSCELPFEVLDPGGELVVPDVNLVMGSFTACNSEDYYFSPMQADKMRENIEIHFPELLMNNLSSFETVDGVPDLVFPSAGEVINIPEDILLEWTVVDGASRYLVEIDKLPTFNSPDYRDWVVYENQTNISLEEGTYYWRVRAFNVYSTCALQSSFKSFSVAIAANTNNYPSTLKSWKVFPNPSNGIGDISVAVNWEEPQEGTLSIFNELGQAIYITKYAGEPLVKIPVNHFQSGQYFLILEVNKAYAKQQFQIRR